MERIANRNCNRLKSLCLSTAFVLAFSVSAQVNSDLFKDYKTFTTTVEKGKAGKFKAQKVKGAISGMGALLLKNGSLYYGDFYDKELQGRGTLITTDSISNCPGCKIYVGRFKNGIKNGKGRCYNSDGELIYEGKFKDDKPTDAYPNVNQQTGSQLYFTEVESDEYRFMGEFSGDCPDGPGIYFFNNGDIYLTSLKEGEQDGLGVYVQSDGNWISEKVENGTVTPISSSAEYETLKKRAKENFRAGLAVALGYFAEAAQKGGEMASQIQSISSGSNSGNVSMNPDSRQNGSSPSSGKSSGSKYNMSEQQSYNRDKSTYNKYDSMLSKAFAGNTSASQSEIQEWQSKMKQLRQKWENQGRNFPHSSNEDR